MHYYSLTVIGCKMAKFYKQGASALRKRCVARTRGVLYISAWSIVSELIAKSSIEHQNFFPKCMQVGVECSTCVVPHNGSSSGNLCAIALQNPSMD